MPNCLLTLCNELRQNPLSQLPYRRGSRKTHAAATRQSLGFEVHSQTPAPSGGRQCWYTYSVFQPWLLKVGRDVKDSSLSELRQKYCLCLGVWNSLSFFFSSVALLSNSNEIQKLTLQQNRWKNNTELMKNGEMSIYVRTDDDAHLNILQQRLHGWATSSILEKSNSVLWLKVCCADGSTWKSLQVPLHMYDSTYSKDFACKQTERTDSSNWCLLFAALNPLPLLHRGNRRQRQRGEHSPSEGTGLLWCWQQTKYIRMHGCDFMWRLMVSWKPTYCDAVRLV